MATGSKQIRLRFYNFPNIGCYIRFFHFPFFICVWSIHNVILPSGVQNTDSIMYRNSGLVTSVSFLIQIPQLGTGTSCGRRGILNRMQDGVRQDQALFYAKVNRKMVETAWGFMKVLGRKGHRIREKSR